MKRPTPSKPAAPKAAAPKTAATRTAAPKTATPATAAKRPRRVASTAKPRPSRATAVARKRVPAIVVHGWKHVSAALLAARESKRAVLLISPPGASYSHGAGFWGALVARAKELFPDVDCDIALDCDGAPGHVLAGLRVGLKLLVFGGNGATRDRLLDIAAQSGATLIPRPLAALDLVHHKDALASCRATLGVAA